MAYPIITKIIAHNNPGTPLAAKGAVIHETANPGDNAKMEFEYFNGCDVGASAHAFIDSNNIIQTIPWNNVAWHAGQTANRQFWGIELCHALDKQKFLEIWKQAAWLVAYLYVNYAYPRIVKVNSLNTMSHAEVSAAWRETDHQDPVSYFAKFGKTIDDFRRDVQVQLDNLLFNRVMSSRIVSSADYWLQNAVPGKVVNGAYMHQLILNFVACFVHVDTFEQAVSYLWQNAIINSHEYWLKNANTGSMVDGAYARQVIVRMGGKI